MGGTVGRCSSDEPTHARQMNQKSDLLNAKILSACEPHYNIYNQWKIIASGCNELLCDIQMRLTYKRDALKLPKQINMWNKQTLKLEIIHHIERNGIISLKRIETLAEGVKNMKKKHFNEYVRDVAMSLPLISFTLPTTEHLFTDPSPQRYYIPKRCAFKEEAVGFYGENVWYMLLDLVIDITVSEKRKNRYLAMLYTHECNDLMCLNDRTGVIVLKNMMDKLFETKTVTSSQTQKLYKMNELNHQTNEDVVMNEAKRCKTKQSQGLWCCRNKHKDFVRQKHVNRWFMQYKIKSCHTWWLLKQQSNEVMIYECDCASVKKVGTKESNCEQRETKLLISAKDLELGRFGDDQSSEFAENLLFLRPISYIFLSGKVVDGRLVRSAGKHLQFNLVAPTSVSKGDAFDMKSGLEYILTNFPEHSDFLLHPPAYDELHDSKIEYKLLFMAFRHRIRLARFFIMHLGIAIDVLFDIKRDSHKLNGTVHQQLQKLSFYIKQNCDHFYKSSTDYLKNEGNELALHDILQQITVKAGQLSIEADVIIGMLNSEQIWEKYLEGELSDHLECELHDVFNEIFELLDPITTISVKKVNVNSSDGGTGVTCYEKNVRYVEAAWSIIAKVDINEKNHTSKGDSKFNKVECVNADAKSKTIMNAPISPTECIAFYDIAGKDLSVIDWSKVGNESKKKWALNQAYINAATYAEMLDGQKSCKSYVQCRVFPPPPDTLDSYRFTPLFNADMVFLFKASKKTKNPFHCVLKRLENVLKHHAYLQHRSRLSIDMNPSHYLSSNPDQCVYEHHHHQNTIGTHIVKLSPYGEWGQTRNPKTNEMEPWFVYPAINCDSPTVNLEAKAKADEEVPVLVFKQRIHAMSLELYDSFFAQIKDISGTDPLKIQTLHLPDNIESLISEFHAKYGVRKRDWLQYLIHEMHLARYLKSVQKANDDEDPQSGSSDDDVPIYVRRIPVIPIIPSETTSADDSSSNDYTSSETDRYEDTSDYSSSDYSSFESSE